LGPRQKKLPRFIPQDLSEEEMKYIFRNKKGKMIYKPVYQAYNEYFFQNIIDETSIKGAFHALQDTSVFERFMLNAAQFSAAKSVAEAKLMQFEIFDKHGKIRSYTDFKKEAVKIATISQQTWLRVEYESQRRQCVMSEQWRRMVIDADLYPYFVHRGRMDSRERIEHKELEGKVYRIQDKESGKAFPPLNWNCRCDGEPVDDEYLKENGLTPVSGDELQNILKNQVDEQFRRSPDAGTLPNSGSYFHVLKNANQGNAEMFGLGDIENDSELEGLAAKGLHHLLDIINNWKDNEKVNKDGDIVFQNKQTYTNVRFTAKSLHEIQKHSRGFENIPDTIKIPDEIWMHWEDSTNQYVVVRNYIKFGKSPYIVQTREGVIVDAFAVSKRSANKYRKGVVI
jgi:SPP1 gp7 family putative phage head morphogenesis protein